MRRSVRVALLLALPAVLGFTGCATHRGATLGPAFQGGEPVAAHTAPPQQGPQQPPQQRPSPVMPTAHNQPVPSPPARTQQYSQADLAGWGRQQPATYRQAPKSCFS